MDFNMSGKRIGVLTSGGDAPGMNAAIRSVVRTALSHDMSVIGIRHGYAGLLEHDFHEMDLLSVSNILQRGGTVLHSSRSKEFQTEKGLQKAAQICREISLDGLVTIGGDGTFRGARDLSLQGVPCVGIPGTIDNHIACSDYTIGFDTAINTVREFLDKLSDTTQSHNRCFLVEVMGHNAGDIALHTGIACGAIAVLLPEMPFNLDQIIEKMMNTKQAGKNYFLIVVSEGVTNTKHDEAGSIFEMAREIEEKTGMGTRANIVGYVQRGGIPTTKERVIASEMGYHAVELLEKGIGNRVVVVRNNEIVDLDILEALSMKKPFNHRLYEIANAISM